MDQKFFGVPFANGGDKSAVPVPVQPSGLVSYTQGFGFDYQRTLGTDPDAKPVPRQGINQLFFDVTDAVGALQRQAFPQWVSPANNGGVAVAYGVGVVVNYFDGANFVPYVSIVAANNVEPGTDPTKWQLFIYQEASQAQAEAGTNGTLLMTPRRVAQAIAALGGAVPAATTVVAGISRYATLAEANAQTVTNAAVTPSALTGYVRNGGSAQQIATSFEFRQNANRVRLFDNNNDVAVLELVAGSGTASDRHGTIANRNAVGSVILSAGNGANALNLTPSQMIVTFGASFGGALSAVDLNISDPDVNGYTQVNFRDNAGIFQNGSSQSGYAGASSLNMGTIAAYQVGFIQNNTLRAAINLAGNFVFSFTTFSVAFQVTSSPHVKNFEEGRIEGAREIVRRIVTRYGAFKPEFNDDTGRQAFFDAENVRAAGLPEVVRDTGTVFDGKPVESLNTQGMLAVLYAAYNEECDRNDALEERLARLEALLAER